MATTTGHHVQAKLATMRSTVARVRVAKVLATKTAKATAGKTARVSGVHKQRAHKRV
jgi:hypothetical protein